MKSRFAAVLGLACFALAAVPAGAQNPGWIRQFGTSGGENAYAAAPYGLGGVYVTGYTNGQFGGPNVGTGQVWLARYNRNGIRIWIRQFGSGTLDIATGAASDGLGGLYVTGWTLGSLGGPSAGGDDAWLAHFDGAGNQLWIRQFGTSTYENAHFAAADGVGGVYLVGFTDGSLGGPNGGLSDAWLARYDSAGNRTWLRQIGGAGNDIGYIAAGDDAGGAYVGGSTTANLGGPNAGNSDIWLARYDGAGNQTWIRQFGGTGSDEPYAAAPAGSLGVYLCGYTNGSVGGPNAGSTDAWIARYDSAGNQTWVRQIGTSTPDHAFAVAPDGSSGVYVSGDTGGSLGGPNAGGNDAWIARYDNAGIQTWIRQNGTSSSDYSSAAATDGAGGVYVGGGTTGSLGGPSEGSVDVWIARYDAAGNGPCGAQVTPPSALIAAGISETEIALWWTDNSDNEDGFTVERGGSGIWSFVGTTAPDVTTFQDTTADCGTTYDYRVRAFNCAGSTTSAQASGSTAICCTSPVAYCAPKINSLGCTPGIGFTGTASFSGPDNFHVLASNVLNNKPGLMIWSLTAASAPFFGGTLCLAAPITRTPGQDSLGSPPPAQDCTGTYSFHFSQAYMLVQLLPSGTQVHAQYWSRDPGFGPPGTPNNIGLTNALSFLICQ